MNPAPHSAPAAGTVVVYYPDGAVERIRVRTVEDGEALVRQIQCLGYQAVLMLGDQ